MHSCDITISPMIGQSWSRVRDHVRKQRTCKCGVVPRPHHHRGVQQRTDVVIRCKHCNYRARGDMLVRGVWERCKVLNKLNKQCRHGEAMHVSFCTCCFARVVLKLFL